MKKAKAYVVLRKGKIVKTDNWYKKPMLVFNKRSDANWWAEEDDQVVRVLIVKDISKNGLQSNRKARS